LINKVWKLTPLRKIGLGLFIMVASFALVALIQRWIDAGGRPNISWQISAFALLTAAEVMVSIVALEFAYTQAPKTMKSLVMCFYLGAVAIGNFFVAGVNHFIQIPDAARVQLREAIERLPVDWQLDPRTVLLPGYDGIVGTDDDFIQRLENGEPKSLEVPGQAAFERAADFVESAVLRDGVFPDEVAVRRAMENFLDPWGAPIRYQILNSTRVRLLSDGPDRQSNTEWDVGMVIDREIADEAVGASWVDRFRPEVPWLERKKRELGAAVDTPVEPAASSFSRTSFAGGQTRLHGAAYFDFFTWLMLATAISFVPYALFYRQKAYFQV